MTDDAYEKSRDHLKNIIKKGQEAINEVQKLARDTQIPDNNVIEEWMGFPMSDEKKEELERMRLANKSFDELTKDQKIQLALEEIDWIVIGGQDGEEYYNSIQFLRKVLKSLRTLEEPSQGHTKTDLDTL
jgi:hypothetical protein